MLVLILVGGTPTPLKNDGVKVSWDADIPNIWKNKHVPNHQPVYVDLCWFLVSDEFPIKWWG